MVHVAAPLSVFVLLACDQALRPTQENMRTLLKFGRPHRKFLHCTYVTCIRLPVSFINAFFTLFFWAIMFSHFFFTFLSVKFRFENRRKQGYLRWHNKRVPSPAPLFTCQLVSALCSWGLRNLPIYLFLTPCWTAYLISNFLKPYCWQTSPCLGLFFGILVTKIRLLDELFYQFIFSTQLSESNIS